MASVLVAIVGAVVVLWIYHAISRTFDLADDELNLT
jgi:hypothetical protein